MIGRRPRAAAWGLAVLFASLVLGAWPRGARVATLESPWRAALGPAEPHAALPPGFVATVDLTTTERFVRVVARDIDRDGDIDVVATVGTLDLLVWKNDGAGHFTRLPSTRRQGFQAQPPAPSFDGESLASSEWIQNDDRSGARLERLEPIVDLAPRRVLSARLRVSAPQSGPRVRSSRAPPLGLPL